MDRLSVRVLGGLDVEGIDQHSIGSRKARLLLRLLVLARGRVVPTPDLADALWGGSPPSRPADQVSVLVSRLRRALGRERIEHADRGYRINYDWLDADELAVMASEIDRRRQAGNVSGAAAAARMALALVRADIPAESDDPEWVLEEIEDLRTLVRRSRRRAAAVLLDAGDWLEAADLAEADLRRDPFDEDAVRVMMRANVTGGRPGVALAAYAALRERLAEELGTDPAAETTELHEGVLRGDPVPRPVVAPRSGFVGRRSQLAHLDSLVARATSGEVQIAVVSGEPGIGKTTLLRTWVAGRREAGDTVLECTCGSLDRAIPLDAVLAALADHLQRIDRDRADAVLGAEGDLLRPLLGFEPATTHDQLVLAEASASPVLLYLALGSVLQRLAPAANVVVTIDDAHLAGPALADWMSHILRAGRGPVVVAAVRSGEGGPLPVHDVIELGPLDRDSAAELVGTDRVDDLMARSLGHPLFLTELAQALGNELPPSLVDAIAARCDQLGPAAPIVRAAAVIGPPIDLDLLATVLHQPPVNILDGVELATERGLLVEDAGEFAFRHDLVRSALAEGTTTSRARVLHREAGRALRSRTDADPVRVAEHARLGGDAVLAGESLRVASARAADRFDPSTAEALLNQSLQLHPDAQTQVARARVRTLRGDYPGALADVEAARATRADALEVGAWAAYFGRDFAAAVRFASDGAVAAEGAARARCLMIGGRTHHARGDLGAAESLFIEALGAATGVDRVAASAWLGVLRAHQSRVDEALTLLRPATVRAGGFEQTPATLHAMLFAGHAHALAGHPASALALFSEYTTEVERRHVPRFAGRGSNFSGWVLRSLGETDRAAEMHREALEVADTEGNPELPVAAFEDLAEDRIVSGEPDAAKAHLSEAQQFLRGDLVFGWRLEMKHLLLRARLALATDEPEQAMQVARELLDTAERSGVPRYAAAAALLVDRAAHRLGEAVDLDVVERNLHRVHRAVAIESWWWAGETGAALGVDRWIDLAETWAGRLARAAGPYETGMQKHADRRLAEWRLRSR
jgi:DNA-binding SARP family transcriptional activator/tetratricopeptide (TPR) repeat protein